MHPWVRAGRLQDAYARKALQGAATMQQHFIRKNSRQHKQQLSNCAQLQVFFRAYPPVPGVNCACTPLARAGAQRAAL
jgi:hypothetical protein